jgi:hypothetical protein
MANPKIGVQFMERREALRRKAAARDPDDDHRARVHLAEYTSN